MMRWILVSVFICASTWAHAQMPAKKLFGAARTPSFHQSASVGGYAKGCLAGAVQLPETGPSWQAMRLSEIGIGVIPR